MQVVAEDYIRIQRFGPSNLDEWKANLAVAAETSKNPELPKQMDVNRVFSSELIDEVNAFDRKAVVQLAQRSRPDPRAMGTPQE